MMIENWTIIKTTASAFVTHDSVTPFQTMGSPSIGQLRQLIYAICLAAPAQQQHFQLLPGCPLDES